MRKIMKRVGAMLNNMASLSKTSLCSTFGLPLTWAGGRALTVAANVKYYSGLPITWAGARAVTVAANRKVLIWASNNWGWSACAHSGGKYEVLKWAPGQQNFNTSTPQKISIKMNRKKY